MLNKICGLARALAILLALVAGFVALGGLDTALALVGLGIIAGIAMPEDQIMRTGVTVLVLPVVAAALGNIPSVGEQLGAVANGLALAGAGSLASGIAIRLFNLAKDDVMGLGGGN